MTRPMSPRTSILGVTVVMCQPSDPRQQDRSSAPIRDRAGRRVALHSVSPSPPALAQRTPESTDRTHQIVLPRSECASRPGGPGFGVLTVGFLGHREGLSVRPPILAAANCAPVQDSLASPGLLSPSRTAPLGGRSAIRYTPPMPSLCRDCLATFDLAARCPACRSPRNPVAPRTVRPDHRPYGLRRFLCLRRKARRPQLARQTRFRRRRPARRRHHRLLHRPDQGRAVRHAHVPGPETLPRGDGREGPDERLCRGLQSDPRDDGRAFASGGTPVAGRSVH